MKNVTPLTHKKPAEIDLVKSNSAHSCTGHTANYLANQIGEAVLLLLTNHMPDIYSTSDTNISIKKDLLWSTVFEIVYSYELSKIKDKPRQIRSRIFALKKSIEKLNKAIKSDQIDPQKKIKIKA